MKIAFNPSTVEALTTPPNNKDITFDLRGRNIFARGVKFQGTDTWRDIKINNVSIGSNILDLQNGSNTTLTNKDGVVTINSTWRPVVDNLTSDSTTSSLSANQGRVLAGLINNHQQIIDMRNYDGSYWHPVTVPLPYRGYNKIKVSVQLNSGDKPSWATHSSGFTCNMEIWAEAHGWGTTNAETICLNYTYAHCNSNPCGWMQLGYPSLGVLFLRGGSRYKVWTDFDATFTPHNKTYTWTSEGGTTQDTGGPRTSCPGLYFNKNRIYANLNGTAENADKLDGYHASYSSNTPWGTIPVITTQGWMDIGKHLEFHNDNSTGSDYSTLLRCTGNYSNIVNLPSESGTLALTKDILTFSNESTDYLSANFNNPDFSKKAASKYIECWDSVGGWWNWMAGKFMKAGSSDNYVLLGGGGHKPLSEFQLGSGSYLPYNGWWASDSGQDVNNANGMIFAYATHKNTPFSSAWGIITTFDYTYNSNYKFQLAANGYSNAMYYRSRSNDRGGWTSWAQVIDTGNIGSQTVANAYHLHINSANTWSTWYWMGQSGQPTWLWGCNDGGNMYVWNPSNFSVKYATSAGSVSNSLNIFGVSYNGSAAKTVTTSTFVSQLEEGTSTVTDGTMFITSWASNSGFADTNAVNVPYKRKASCLWSYIDSKISSKYLPLAGGTMNGNARIGHGSGSLYIGNSGNDGWIYTQDIASQKGIDKWAIRESGAAHFGNVYICTKSDYTTYDSSIIECYGGNNLYLNYYSPIGINLCNGGGTVQIGSYTTGDTGNNKLYVNGSEFINGASNVKNHVFADGFRHRSHNSNDSVLLAGGGYSQGVPVRYWAIYYMYIGNSSTDVTYTKRSGNYDFITSKDWESEGVVILGISFPSGYNKNNTLIFGNGDHRTSSSWKTPVYVTITTSPQFGQESKIRVMISDDASLNTGFANIYFMCMG